MSNGRRQYVNFHEYKRRLKELEVEANTLARSILDMDEELGSSKRTRARVLGEAFEHLAGIQIRLSNPKEEIFWQFALSPVSENGDLESVHDVVDYLVGDICYEVSLHVSNKKLDQVYKQLIAVRKQINRRVDKYGKIDLVVLGRPPYTNTIWDRIRQDINVVELGEIETEVSDLIKPISDAIDSGEIPPLQAERLALILYNINLQIGSKKIDQEQLRRQLEFIGSAIATKSLIIEKYTSIFGELFEEPIPSRMCFYEDKSGRIKRTHILTHDYQYPKEKLDTIKRHWEDMGENPEDFDMSVEVMSKIKKYLEGLLGKDAFYKDMDGAAVLCEETKTNGEIEIEYLVSGVPIAQSVQIGPDAIEAVAYNPRNGAAKIMYSNGTDAYLTVDGGELMDDLVRRRVLIRKGFSELYSLDPVPERIAPMMIDLELSIPTNRIVDNRLSGEFKRYVLENLN